MATLPGARPAARAGSSWRCPAVVQVAVTDAIIDQPGEVLHLGIVLAVATSARQCASCSAGMELDCCAWRTSAAARSRLPSAIALAICAPYRRCSPAATRASAGAADFKFASVCAASSSRAAVHGLVEAPGEHSGHALQTVTRLGVVGVGGDCRAVVEQGVVAGGLGEAALVHRQSRLLQQLVDLALEDRGVGDRRHSPWRGGGCRRRVGGGAAGCALEDTTRRPRRQRPAPPRRRPPAACGVSCQRRHARRAVRPAAATRRCSSGVGVACVAAAAALLVSAAAMAPLEHRLGLRRRSVSAAPQNLLPLSVAARLLHRRVGEHHHGSAGCAALRAHYRGTRVRHRARIDHQHLGALAAGHRLERGFERFDRPDRGLAAERLAELEKEFILVVMAVTSIAGCDASTAAAGGRRRTYGRRKWTDHLSYLHEKTVRVRAFASRGSLAVRRCGTSAESLAVAAYVASGATQCVSSQ